MENLLDLDRENRTVLWKHVLWFESVVNPISRSSWQLNPIFPINFVSVIVRKEGPAPTPSCSRIVALSFSTLCLRISQLYFLVGAGKGYNSAVECHLDVVEVISSSLIIPKPNRSCEFFYFDLPPRRDRIRMGMDKRLVGLTWGGRAGYISGSELQANMKRMDTSYALEWKTIPNQLCLRTRKL